MRIGRVIGSVVTTYRHPAYDGTKLLIVELLDPRNFEPTGKTVVAIDTVDAGDGDVVIVVDEGRAARDVLGKGDVPVRTLVIGVCDSVEVAEGDGR